MRQDAKLQSLMTAGVQGNKVWGNYANFGFIHIHLDSFVILKVAQAAQKRGSSLRRGFHRCS